MSMLKKMATIGVMGLVALGMTALLVTAAPSILASKDGTAFKVTYEKGAVWTCVVFRMVEATETNRELWPDGHYAPRSCGPLNPTSTTYVEEWSPYIRDPRTGQLYNVDWDVYAIVQYPSQDGSYPAVESNRVRVRY